MWLNVAQIVKLEPQQGYTRLKGLGRIWEANSADINCDFLKLLAAGKERIEIEC